MVRAHGGVVKARMAHAVLTGGRGMPEDTGEEVVHVQTQSLGAVITVVGVGHAHEAGGVDGQRPVGGNGPALDVAREVLGDAVGAVVGWLDLDVPVLGVQALDERGASGLVHGRRQRKRAGAQQVRQGGEDLAAEQGLQRAQRKQEALTKRLPAAVGIHAAGADEGVHVRVIRKVASPGVQRQQQARDDAAVAGRAEHLQQALAYSAHEQVDHRATVEAPEVDEFVRQREDDVEVRAGQQPLQLCVDPLAARSGGASRATAMTAGVVLHLLDVPGRAHEQVLAERGRVAMADAPGRVGLAPVQAMHGGVVVEVIGHELLQGTAHRAPPRPGLTPAASRGLARRAHCARC